MTEPVDAIRAFHNAFRNDLERIDTAAFNWAKGKEGPDPTLERLKFFNEILVWHAHGEEVAIFPAIENVAPLVAEAYIIDHHGLDAAFDELRASYSARDPLKTARATAAYRFHLKIHLDKEDTHLYRIFRERIPLPEQGKAVAIMASNIPKERFAEMVAWLYPQIGIEDRVNMTRIWQIMMPVPVFAGVKELIRKSIGSDWAELSRNIPTL
jgi:hemerythrin-like domain-containing protein